MKIEKLASGIDSRTKVLPYNGQSTLWLFGSEESRFLRGIAGKCRKMGYNCEISDHPHQIAPTDCYVLDSECGFDLDGYIPEFRNIDPEDEPAVRSAIMVALHGCRLPTGSSIAIIGRGRSVRGLADLLVKADYTVTQAHSKTLSMAGAVVGKDALLYATPECAFSQYTKLCIDLSGTAKKFNDRDFFETYIGPSDIGRLTTSVLVNRYVRFSEGMK